MTDCCTFIWAIFQMRLWILAAGGLPSSCAFQPDSLGEVSKLAVESEKLERKM